MAKTTSIRQAIATIVLLAALSIVGCSVIKAPYTVTKNTLKSAYLVTKYTVQVGMAAGTVIYHVGRFTFHVAKAPLEWPLMHKDIESIDDMPPQTGHS